jgi:bifunctional N-acetylglucosamine-1-phosphate-uridyltransferase/glucosamine-1-phosphate-acetyltransferase GlmU-like protein
METDVPKALVRFKDQFLIEYSTAGLAPFSSEIIIVVSPTALETFEEVLPSLHGIDVKCAVQEKPRGTAEAIQNGIRGASNEMSVIVWADHIGAHFFGAELLSQCMNTQDWDIIVPMVERNDPYVYFDVDSQERITRFYETRTGAPNIKHGKSDCGVFLVRNSVVGDELTRLATESETEVNFLNLIPIMNKTGLMARSVLLTDERLTFGANSVADLKMADLQLKCFGEISD